MSISVPFGSRIEKSELTHGKESNFVFFFPGKNIIVKMYYDELDMEVVEEYTTEYSDAYCCLF